MRGLRDRAHDQAIQLADLEEREQLAAERILHERDEIAAVEDQLVGARDQLASARADKRGALAQVHDSRVRLEGDLSGARGKSRRASRPPFRATRAEPSSRAADSSAGR